MQSDVGEVILEGRISVQAALIGRSRPIRRILLQEGKRDPPVLRLENLARAAAIPVERVDRQIVEDLAAGRTHGGVLAIAGERRHVSVEALLPEGAVPFLVMVDGVEDPYNFGAALRSLYAAGAHGLVVRERSWLSAASIIARSSAGASELLPTAVVSAPEEAATWFRAQGVTVAAAEERRGVSLYETDLTVPLFLLIGGEQRGITRSFRDQVDVSLRIPYARDGAPALGTAAAAAVVAFEVMRQRTCKRSD